MNVNGQNGVATSAKMMCENKFRGLMYNDQTASIMYEIGCWTSEQKQGLLDKILRMRMRNKSAITFVYNDIKFTLNWNVIFSTSERIFQIYASGKTNGRYSYGASVAIRRFPNYYGISEVFNTLMRDLVADMFEVADIEKAESDRKLAEDLNSPDTLNDIESIMEFFGNDDMTIRKFFEKHKVDDGWGSYVTADSINNYVGEFMSPGAVEIFNNLVEKDEDWSFYIDEDGDGDLYVSGNEGCCWTYFDDNAPMVLVYGCLMDKMNEEIIKIETEIEKEIEGAEYKVLDAFEITNAQGENSLKINYDEWWDYVLGETPDWIKDKYYDKFCDVLYYYFVKFAKDYDYGVEEIDGGISLEKPDYNN